MLTIKDITIKSQELSLAISRLSDISFSDECRQELLDLAQLIQAQITLLAQNKAGATTAKDISENINKLIYTVVQQGQKQLISKIDLLVLKTNYQLIAKHFQFLENDKQKKIFENNHKSQITNGRPSSRQEAILTIFNTANQVIQLKDIMHQFPDFSDRTIRIDLYQLVRAGYLSQNGFGRGSFYTLIRDKLNKEE